MIDFNVRRQIYKSATALLPQQTMQTILRSVQEKEIYYTHLTSKQLFLCLCFAVLALAQIGQAQDCIADLNLTPTELSCGDVFYDTGGAEHRYTDEPTITIICPDNQGQVVQVDFQNFDVGEDDILQVFDGNTLTAPILAPDSGTGYGVGAAPNRGLISASCENRSGCLTFVFCVDEVGFGAGWYALIDCIDRPDTEFDVRALEDIYTVADCGEAELSVDIPIPYHEICGEIRDVRITASCSDYIAGFPPNARILADGNGTIPLTFPLGLHTLTFSSTAFDHEDFKKTIRVRVGASRMRCKDAAVLTARDECYVHLEPSAILENTCPYNNEDSDIAFTYEVEVTGLRIIDYNEDGYPIIDITDIDCGSSYQVSVIRSYTLDWNCNGDPNDDDPLEDECSTFITIEDYVTPIIENGPAVVQIPCYDDPGEQVVFDIRHGGGQVFGEHTGSVYVIPGIDNIEVIDNCEYDLIISDWEYEVADCTTEPLETDAPVFHYYQRKIVAVDQCGNRHSTKQRIAIVQPPIYPPLLSYQTDCTTDLDQLALVQAWYDWVAEGRPAADPRADYALYVPVFDPTPDVGNGTSNASGDEIPVAPNNASSNFPTCGYNVTYEDTINPTDCAGSQEIQRTWRVFSWCKSGDNQSDEYQQRISIGDGYPPEFIGEPTFTFSPYEGDPNCTGEITFAHPNVVDACGGNVFATITYKGVEKSFVSGPVSFQNVTAGTTITVSFSATDECDDEAQVDYEIAVEGCCTPVIVCPNIPFTYLNEDCEARLEAAVLAAESSSFCSALTHSIALQSDDSDDDGYPEEEDYSEQIVFTDLDLVDCQQADYILVLRSTDEDGTHYYCEIEGTLRAEQDSSISCEDISPHTIYAWDAMAEELYRVSESSEPVIAFQDLIDSGNLGTSLWETGSCLGNTWVEIIEVDYEEYYGYCPGGKISYTFKLRNECGYISDACQNYVLIDGNIDWTMNFPPDYTVSEDMIPQTATLNEIVSDNSDSWEMEVVIETASTEDCSRTLIYNYYLKNRCTWNEHDDCAAIVERPEELIEGLVLRYQNNEEGTNAIDDGNEALDNDGFDLTSRSDDGDFVRLADDCTPSTASIYTAVSSFSGGDIRNVSAQEYGYIHYQQIVIVKSGEVSAPIIQALNLEAFCGGDINDPNGGCSAAVDIRLGFDFGCADNKMQDYEVKLKLFGEGTAVIDSYGEIFYIDENHLSIQGDYPLDPDREFTEHILLISQGTHSVELPFVLKDCAPPVISACSDFVVETNSGEITLRAEDLSESSYDLCSDYSELAFYFADPSENPELIERSFSCEDGRNGIIPYTIWVADKWGNTASCSGNVIMPCDIGLGAAAIGGQIAMENGAMIQDVQVSLNGGAEKAMMTTNDGQFMFEELPTANAYITRPYRNDKAINGVTTYDLVFMSRHILGTRLFTSPYEMIAADVNNSGSITTFDVVILRKLILGQVEEFNGNTSWRFIPASYEFPDPTNPWLEDFPEEINITSLSEDEMDNNFIGLKVGDVNASARPSNTQGNPEGRNTSGQVSFQVEDIVMKAGTSYVVPFYLESDAVLAGYQFSLGFDTDAVELTRIEAGLVGVEYFGMKYAHQGIVTSSWNSMSSMDLDTSRPIFYAVFRSKTNTQLSEVLILNSSRLVAEAYTKDDARLDLRLDFNNGLNNSLTLYQNSPNPFSDFTKLSFFLPEASKVSVEVLNTSGQLLKIDTYQLDKGKHQLNIDLNGLPEEGLFYYQLSANKATATGKMLRIRK